MRESFAVWWPLAIFFLAASTFRKYPKASSIHLQALIIRLFEVIVAPFLRPANKVGDTPPLPYYLYVSASLDHLL